MASGNPKLSALRILDPAGAAMKIKLALRAARGDVGEAAEKLGVNRRSLFRWIHDHPELGAELRKLRADAAAEAARKEE
jgi:DNA-binding NtrC family response regulator